VMKMHRIILKRSSGLFMGNDVPHIIEWSGLAIIDRDSLYQWLYEKNKSAAKRIEGKIRGAITLLKDAPGMGSAYDIKGVRKHPIQGTEFTVFYTIEGNSIVILRVLHQSLDVPSVRFTDDGGRWLM